MSRIGKQLITLPAGVSVSLTETSIQCTGSKGSLFVRQLPGVTVTVEPEGVHVGAESVDGRQYQGLVRTLLQNAVTGVSAGWQKDLELQGVGMKASLAGTSLALGLGFSHPVNIPAPEGIAFSVVKNIVSINGIDKQQVGEIAAQIRKLRKPEPYKGKGIRYVGEHVRRKAGKTGKAGK